MPYYRSYRRRRFTTRRYGTSRRPAYRRRRTGYSRRRTGGYRRPSRLSYGTQYSFKRTMHAGQVLVSQTDDAGTTYLGYSGAYTFKLSDLPNYTEFTNLYDQYKITGIAIEFRPTFSGLDLNFSANSANGTLIPDIRSVVDLDDDTPIANENELLQYQNIKWTRGTKVHRRYFKPKFATEIFRTALTTGYRPSQGYLDTSYPEIPHYGFKVWIDDTAATEASAWLYRVYVTYYVKFKGVK